MDVASQERLVRKGRSRPLQLMVGSGIAALVAGAAQAQSVLPGATEAYLVREVQVVGQPDDPLSQAKDRAQATAGGVSIIAAETMQGAANVTLADALSTAPGVVVQSFFGANDQPRVQIRGSGLQQNPVERGVLVLQDGLPMNGADGSYVVGLVDPRQAAFIEVFRGYTANRLGSTVLGGAVNFVSRTGEEAQGLRLRGEVGEFGHGYAALDGGLLSADWDAQASISHTQRDGYRTYNASRRTSSSIGATYRWSQDLTLRVLAGHVDNRFDVAGPLSRALLEADPTAVSAGPTIVGGVAQNPGPNVIRDKPRRDTALTWAGTRITADAGPATIDAAMSYVKSEDSFLFPVSAGERVTDGGAFNGMVRYAYDRGGRLPVFEATLAYSDGVSDRDYYLNAAGVRGALFGTGELAARTFSVNLNGNIALGPNINLAPSVSFAHAQREFEDRFTAPRRPTLAFNPMAPTVRLPDGSVPTVDASFERSYEALSPAVALSWAPSAQDYLFVAYSRTFEPPSHDDLLATIGGTPNSSAGRPAPGNPALPSAVFATPDLEAQTSDTIEFGWRGTRGGVEFDLLAYHAWVENELLSLRDASGVSLGAVNAGETRHLGVELGARAQLNERLLASVAYVYQDFRFKDDALRGDNRLAGAPPHVVNIGLAFEATPRLNLAVKAHWLPSETPVDNLNTLHNDAYGVFDLRAAYDVSDKILVHLDIKNTLDQGYASSTLIVDQARTDQAVYIPGDGRAIYAGASVKF